jgi:hypothetical protein
MGQTVDRNGNVVRVRTRVLVLEIAPSLLKDLPPDECLELQAMVGVTFGVYEIDEHGAAWVQTPLVRKDDGYRHSHSIGLDPHEMEVVPPSRARRPTTR